MDAIQAIGTLLERVNNPEIVIIVVVAMYLGYKFLRFVFGYAIDKLAGFFGAITTALNENNKTNVAIQETMVKLADSSDGSQRAVVKALDVLADRTQAGNTLIQNLTVAHQDLINQSDKRHVSLESKLDTSRSEMQNVVTIINDQLEKITMGINILTATSERHEENAAQRTDDMKVLQRQLIISTQELQAMLGRMIKPIEASETPDPPPPETNPETGAETPAQADIATPEN